MKKRWKWLSRERKYWKLVGCLEKMLEMGQICRNNAGNQFFFGENGGSGSNLQEKCWKMVIPQENAGNGSILGEEAAEYGLIPEENAGSGSFLGENAGKWVRYVGKNTVNELFCRKMLKTGQTCEENAKNRLFCRKKNAGNRSNQQENSENGLDLQEICWKWVRCAGN